MKDVKIISFYLPQFHEIEENNKWWGKGFTEWVNTKKAKEIFKNQNQPREPFNDNYYNLLNDDVKQWQVDIAKKYGIDGFCYYHYWFNGKMLLEKPLEQVLANKNIDLPFCISWANEPWTRAWDGKTSEVLIGQDYGDKEDWYRHFEYLLQFFKDERYIKVKNKPMLVIYKLQSIPNRDEMVVCWNNLAKKQGFDGIYLVETLNGLQKEVSSELSDAAVEFEPNFTIHHNRTYGDKIKNKLKNILYIPFKGKNFYKTMDYDITWKRIIKRQKFKTNKDVFPGAFVDWDNTARKGDKALVFDGVTPEKFENYLSKQLEKAKREYKSEYIFINAWNEWAEGTYLEPDKKNGYKYLEAVKRAKSKVNNI